MNDPLTRLTALKRPALLMAAARLAAQGGHGGTDTRRHLQGEQPKGPQECILRLLEVERPMEEARSQKSAAYNPTRHVEVMAALLREAGRITPSRDRSQVKASVTSPLRLAT